ncbi:hypothetical protein OB2597_06695 [Pseudooceanicola batsensis HTCC2597]|uniref:Uncharacterized protein n=1 Tax=Pseudooceanicola batsensis (strain ATCC BAA-863 / DSM 15984 / KCTC 12145 / HTCC2597) TaxID=252305 RepID=A3TTH4_PSEBH|nr:hypothetical protein OB2597_06695 [Pseudooceanicola batsensis HTCC2597]
MMSLILYLDWIQDMIIPIYFMILMEIWEQKMINKSFGVVQKKTIQAVIKFPHIPVILMSQVQILSLS